jgi:signal transduction histidine kinase/ligand-binding sensor domain-containing protein
MWTAPRNLLWLISVAVAPGLFSEALREGDESVVLGPSGFHHTEWSGLGAVFDIKQSSEGYLWLTTSRGVLRFDGARFQSLEEVTRAAVHDSDIDSVFLSSSGGLWLPTQGGGLLFWKDGRLSNFPDRRCTPSRKQGQIVEDRDGSLWVQATAGLFRLRGSACEQIGAEQGYPGGFPAAILLDSQGALWVKTQTGPLVFLPRGQSRFQVTKYGEGVSTGFAFLHEGPDGAIWLSDDQGLRRIASKEGSSFPLPSRVSGQKIFQFGDFTFSPDGSLWAVTNKGVQRFDHVEGSNTPLAREAAPGQTFTPEEGLSSDAVWKVVIDRKSVWIATNSGLDRLRRADLNTVRFPQAQEHEFSVAPGDGSSIWTGNSSLPLTRIAPDGTRTSIAGTRQTTSVRRDHNGTIWSAGAGDSYLWRSSGGRSSGDRFAPLHYPEEKLDAVLFVAVDRNNEPWITTSSGRAYHLAGGSWSNQTEALGKKPGVRGAMVDDADGNVWFAFSNKVVQWDGSTYHRFSFPDGQRGVSENTMSVRGVHVWLGGAGGVQLFTQGNFYLMRWKDQGMPGRVSGLVETEKGDLWVNGFSGITHVSSEELDQWLHDPTYAVSAEHLDELNGLPGLSGEVLPEPSLVEAPDGKLWFATTKGIAWLNPEIFEKNRNPVPPTVMISAVISGSQSFPPSSSALTLPARTENLEIDYTALSRSVPERVLFRYKLDGADSDWQSAGTRRQALYPRLRPGNYTFHVIACNNDGVWNESGATLGLSVAPSWYQSTWFFLVSATGGIALAAALHRLRLRRLAANLDARFNERLAERTRIAQELHDTLLQGFLSASMHLHVAVDNLPPDSPARNSLGKVTELMRRVIDEGRDALRGLRASQSTSLDLEQAFSHVRQEFQAQADVAFHVIVLGKTRPWHPLIRDEVYRIGREALINALRHSHAKEIEIELEYAATRVRVLVRDNGCGMDSRLLEAGKEGHFGLTGMRERAEKIGGRLRIWSKLDGGTEVELSIPGPVAFRDDGPGWIQRWLAAKAVGKTETEVANEQRSANSGT